VASPETDPRQQLALERLNTIRADPAGLAPELEDILAEMIREQPDRCGTPTTWLDSVRSAEARPPLAPLATLAEVARSHSHDMLERRFFDHTNPDGVGSNDRVRAAGISLETRVVLGDTIHLYGNDPGDNQLESIYQLRYRRTGPRPTAEDSLFSDGIDSLVIDRCVPSLGHREHLLGTGPLNARDREVGIGYALYEGPDRERPGWSGYELELTVLTLAYTDGDPYLLGVVYEDVDGDGRYSAGEGLPEIAVEFPGQGLHTTTTRGGGYALPLPVGTEGAVRTLGVERSFRLGTSNQKIDFTLPPGQGGLAEAPGGPSAR